MAFDVVVVGSANLDLVATAPRLPRPGETVAGTDFAEHPGGKGLNQAVAAARSGSAVALVAAVGADDAGRRLRSVAEHDGIDVAFLDVVEGATTGRALITVDDHAENCIVVIAGANQYARVRAWPAARSSSAVALAQLEVPISTVVDAFRAARAAGCRTVLNPAPAPPSGLPDELLALCDLIVPNEHEAELLGGAEHLLNRGVGAVVTTLGSAGVTVREASASPPWRVDAFEVTPIDTTGAGDAFCGALASSLAGGGSLHDAVRFAAAAGALATTTVGAVPSIPHVDDINRLLAATT